MLPVVEGDLRMRIGWQHTALRQTNGAVITSYSLFVSFMCSGMNVFLLLMVV